MDVLLLRGMLIRYKTHTDTHKYTHTQKEAAVSADLLVHLRVIYLSLSSLLFVTHTHTHRNREGEIQLCNHPLNTCTHAVNTAAPVSASGELYWCLGAAVIEVYGPIKTHSFLDRLNTLKSGCVCE